MAKDARLVMRLDHDLLDAIRAAGQLNGHSTAAEARLALHEHVARTAHTLRSDDDPADRPGRVETPTPAGGAPGARAA